MPSPFGLQLRYWRNARGLSQLALAARAGSTTRHVSFLESGRSRPTERMVRRLAGALTIPIAEQAALLKAAGFAVSPPESEAPVSMLGYESAAERLLREHEPFPAVVTNRSWDVLAANQGARRFFAELGHERGVSNLVLWFFDRDSGPRRLSRRWPVAAYAFLARIRRELLETPDDERLQGLARHALRELSGVEPPDFNPDLDALVCPELTLNGEEIALIGLAVHAGDPRSGLRVECIYPRDQRSTAYFERLAQSAGESVNRPGSC